MSLPTRMSDAYALIRAVVEELECFPNRTLDLRAMKRYERYPLMFYRTELYVHGKRIAASVAYAASLIVRIFPQFNFERALTLALVHDDAELVMGDFQSSNRALMNERELAVLDTNEERAIEVIEKRYPREIHGFVYEELLKDILNLTTPEAQVVKYLDKFEGFMEAVHEAYAGNSTFLEHPPTEFGIPPNPYEYYPVYFKDIYTKNPTLAPFKGESPFFTTTFTHDWPRVVSAGSLHTEESLKEKKSFEIYGEWLRAQQEAKDNDILESLLVVKENI